MPTRLRTVTPNEPVTPSGPALLVIEIGVEGKLKFPVTASGPALLVMAIGVEGNVTLKLPVTGMGVVFVTVTKSLPKELLLLGNTV